MYDKVHIRQSCGLQVSRVLQVRIHLDSICIWTSVFSHKTIRRNFGAFYPRYHKTIYGYIVNVNLV